MANKKDKNPVISGVDAEIPVVLTIVPQDAMVKPRTFIATIKTETLVPLIKKVMKGVV
jgi:hypothetical protein